MFKKITDQHKRWIALGIGVAFVLLGVTQALFKIEFFIKYRDYIDKFYYWGFIIAAMLIFSIRRKPKTEETAEQKQLDSETATTETKENS